MFAEFAYYLKKHRRWIFMPLMAAVVLFAVLTVFSHLIPIVSPFIYTLF